MIADWLKKLGFGQAPAAIPDALWQRTVAAFPFLAALNADENARLRRLTEGFLAEKEFSAGGRLALTDDICLAIAAQGCLPILELGLAAYRDWVGIIVYPDEFVVPRRIEDEHGLIHEYDDVLAGEAWPGGPLIVSWRDVQMAGEADNDGYNVVIHEFAHKLDMLNGEVDGVPALHSGIDPAAWRDTLMAAYDEFCAQVDKGRETLLDPYGSEHPGEFFAVLTETFFTFPEALRDHDAALYALLQRYYRQDPLARLVAPKGTA